MPDYRQLAIQQYDPAYNAKVQALKAAYQNSLTALNNQRSGINQNYDAQVENQNRNNSIAKNNFSNQMLNRGLGRSTIATTGLGSMDLTNNRLINSINNARTDALNNLQAQISTLTTNHENELAQLAGDRETAIMALARQLETEDFNKQRQLEEEALRKRQFEAQLKQMEWERQMKEKELALAQAKARSSSRSSRSSSSSGISKTALKNAAWYSFNKVMNTGNISDAYNWLNENKQDLIRTIGESEYSKMHIQYLNKLDAQREAQAGGIRRGGR